MPVDLRLTVRWDGDLQASRQLPPAQTRRVDASKRLGGELVNEHLGQVRKVLIVLERLFDVDRALRSGVQDVRDGFPGHFGIDVRFANAFSGVGYGLQPRERPWTNIPGARRCL